MWLPAGFIVFRRPASRSGTRSGVNFVPGIQRDREPGWSGRAIQVAPAVRGSVECIFNAESRRQAPARPVFNEGRDVWSDAAVFVRFGAPKAGRPGVALDVDTPGDSDEILPQAGRVFESFHRVEDPSGKWPPAQGIGIAYRCRYKCLPGSVALPECRACGAASPGSLSRASGSHCRDCRAHRSLRPLGPGPGGGIYGHGRGRS